MNVVVAIEHHFVKTPKGVWTTLAFGHEYWREYLEVFDSVLVLGRVGRAETVGEEYFRADGPGVEFIPVPDYYGPVGLLRTFPGVLSACWRAASAGDCFLLRSGNVGIVLWLCLLLWRRPYAREVQGDMGESVRQVTRHSYPIAGRILGSFANLLAEIQVRYACCASYVSEAMRRRYPGPGREREFVFSSVRLNEQLVTRPRSSVEFSATPLRILSVGRLEPEKGHHVLIAAADKLRGWGLQDWEIRIVGPGRQQEPLRRLAETLGVSRHVEVLGPAQYGKDLFMHYDWAHLFVLPSLTEGLPRSLIEAMARGCAAIGSDVGGIPELLTEAQLVPPGDPESLGRAIANRLSQAERLAAESSRNFRFVVENYGPERMGREKLSFWRCLAATSVGRLRTGNRHA